MQEMLGCSEWVLIYNLITSHGNCCPSDQTQRISLLERLQALIERTDCDPIPNVRSQRRPAVKTCSSVGIGNNRVLVLLMVEDARIRQQPWKIDTRG
jgi:hypothetical protein